MNHKECENPSNTTTMPECHLSVCPTEMRKTMSYCRDYILIGNFVLMVLLPFILISVLNGCLYQYIRRNRFNITTSRQKRDLRIAVILVIIVIVFGVCNIPRVFINLYEVLLFYFLKFLNKLF